MCWALDIQVAAPITKSVIWKDATPIRAIIAWIFGVVKPPVYSSLTFKLRTEKGMSQTAVGEKVGVSRQMISVWEKGDSKPSPDRLEALSKILGTTVDYLVSGEPAVSPEADEPETHEKYITKKHKLSFKTILLRVMIVVAVAAAVLLWGIANDAIMTAFVWIEVAVIILLVCCVVRALFYIAMYFREKAYEMKIKRQR